VNTTAGIVVALTVAEPARVELPQLFKIADTVATVRIVSGDTENYDRAVYKANVIRSFKGHEARLN
jgi:hypothetical protein